MVYLEQFRFPDAEVEFDFFLRQKRTCYDFIWRKWNGKVHRVKYYRAKTAFVEGSTI